MWPCATSPLPGTVEGGTYLVTRILVWMEFQGQLAKGLLYLLLHSLVVIKGQYGSYLR